MTHIKPIRPTTPSHCRDCGISFTVIAHRARGRCASDYRWHSRHGWDRVRVAGQWGITTANMKRVKR